MPDREAELVEPAEHPNQSIGNVLVDEEAPRVRTLVEPPVRHREDAKPGERYRTAGPPRLAPELGSEGGGERPDGRVVGPIGSRRSRSAERENDERQREQARHDPSLPRCAALLGRDRPESRPRPGGQPPIKAWNAGSSRTGSKSESPFAMSRHGSHMSIARRRCSTASAVRPARLSQQARLKYRYG